MQIDSDILFIKYSMDVSLREYLAITSEWDRSWSNMVELENGTSSEEHVIAQERIHTIIRAAEAKKIAFILSAVALIEAMANLVFTMRLNSEQFSAIEKCGLEDKWTGLMSLVVPAFSIKHGSKLCNSLKELSAERNRIVHMKPRAVSGDGKNVLHKGYLPKHSKGSFKILRVRLQAWHELPKMLIKEIENADANLGRHLALFSGHTGAQWDS